MKLDATWSWLLPELICVAALGCQSDDVSANGDSAGESSQSMDAAVSPEDGPGATLQSGLGASCTQRNDCALGLDCVAEPSNQWSGGGPAGGYCTKGCAENRDCADVDAASICQAGFCLASCLLGAGDTSKCRERPDTACAPFADLLLGIIVGGCVPVCRFHGDCGSGRLCDFGAGVCVNGSTATEPFGVACDPTAEPRMCSGGFCGSTSGATGSGNVSGTCTGLCRLGQRGCGEDPGLTRAEPEFQCALEFGEGAVGDLGLCFAGCTLDAGCPSAELQCFTSRFSQSPEQGVCFDRASPPLGSVPLGAGTSPDAG